MTQACDILLFKVGPGSNWLEKLIGWGQKVMGQSPTRNEYWHVALVDKPGSIIEASWPKVRRRLFYPADYRNVEIYRVKEITEEQVQRVLLYARQHIGELYNSSAILTFGIVQFGHSVVCSQFVWEAFIAGGIVLCEYENLECPDNIAASPLLTKVIN